MTLFHNIVLTAETLTGFSFMLNGPTFSRVDDLDDPRSVTRYFPGWELRLTVVPQDAAGSQEPSSVGSSPGHRRQVLAVDGEVWAHLRKVAPVPAFLERIIRSGSPLYIFHEPCPDAAQVRPDAALAFWLEHKARLMDGSMIVDEAGEMWPDPTKDAQAFIFDQKPSRDRLVLLEFGYC